MRKKHHHLLEDEGESYFASFTDLLVGIIFIFIILLTQSAEQFKAKTDSDLAAQEARSAVLNAIVNDLKAQSIRIEFDIKNGIIRLPEGVVFDVGQSDLAEDKKPKVHKIFETIGNYLPCLTDSTKNNDFCTKKFPFYAKPYKDRPRLNTLLIEGHTDKQKYANDAYGNWKLSVNRAVNVYQFFWENFPDIRDLTNQDKQNLISVSGYGDTRPLPDENADLLDNPKDRRIDLRFVMETSEPEPVKEIKQDTELQHAAP